MERRNFLKISALTSVAATLDACGNPEHQLIQFIPEENLVPGIATWKPSVCTLCAAGCGLLVRVMEGDAEVRRNGKAGLMKMGLAKKLEGNPNHPVNRGKLCALGQAGLQVTYHPDRVKNPLKRSGPRGSGEFQEIGWEDAIRDVTAHLSTVHSSGAGASLAFLTRPLGGQRKQLLVDFQKALGGPPPVSYELFDDAVLRQANFWSFGRAELPTIDIGRADYLISFGADFLGTWNSPVSQGVGYGEMRQGRGGHRGKFVQVEARMSQTGANADEWIACQPGMEGVLALGLAHVILQEKHPTREGSERAGSLIAGWTQGLRDYTPEAVEKKTGVAAATIRRLAHEIAEVEAGTAIIGGAPLAHTNGLFNGLAVNALEELVDGGAGEPILSFTPDLPLATTEQPASGAQGSFSAIKKMADSILLNQPSAPRMLMMYEANPVFSAPPSVRIKEALAKVPYIVSFGSFIDETSVLADLILPDHSPLESWLDDVPQSGTTQAGVSVAPPAVRPLHNTRAMPDVVLEIASQLGGAATAALPWKTFDAMLRAAYTPLRTHPGSVASKSEDEFWEELQRQGGWWNERVSSKSSSATAGQSKVADNRGATGTAGSHPAPAVFAEPQFDGAGDDFAFYFLPYASQALRDGSVAHLPWMQEMPDVVTSAMWSSWVEINAKTAERLQIHAGDIVQVSSQHGSLQAPAIVSPGIAPNIVAMPIGQGHENFSRYASGRGTNPLSIVAALSDSETGSLAWAATRVKVKRVGNPEEAKLILFGGGMSRFPSEGEPR